MQFQSQGSRGAHVPRSGATSIAMKEQVDACAKRHGFSAEAGSVLWRAICNGRGHMAQFDHPELGGAGQWLRGGMVMVGDMFNHALAARVSAIADDLAQRHDAHPELAVQDSQHSESWWPADLGRPAAAGSQDGMRYAYFPERRRLAIERGGRLELFDTGEHLIGGVSQQQGSGRDLSFSSQLGAVPLPALRRVELGEPGTLADTGTPEVSASAYGSPAPAAQTPARGQVDIFDAIERLADLKAKGILSDAEFQAKKVELLARL